MALYYYHHCISFRFTVRWLDGYVVNEAISSITLSAALHAAIFLLLDYPLCCARRRDEEIQIRSHKIARRV